MTRAAPPLIAALLLWQLLVQLTGVPRFLLPAPSEIGAALWQNRAMLAAHGLVTFAEMLAALICGAALGVLLGLWLAWSETALRLVRPVLVFSQTVPIFTLAPLLTLWLGYGFGSKLATGVLVVFFPVASAFLDALLRTPAELLDLAKVMGARRGRLLWLIRLPAARPGLASGLRLAAVYAPIGAVLGEWVGASRGLGYLMLLANGSAKTPLMFAALVVLSALTFGLTRATGLLAARLERV
ncbi:ABC transporter permease [Cereibacter changlensis JA139]|uniref:ABC transporter permease n=2 Tax=Cereibacter changlensis TaxID=402884 RepID=A0A2T4JP66_9RHOB|nr:ABC transporter permease [Cereibacter changlensis]PTE19675.1 ABC transporter permease [Cereibacter changlensis JA139]PZX57520.1 putative hydroxymethylpyrimidine transport system permease protein [Cereibacter changlensis]